MLWHGPQERAPYITQNALCVPTHHREVREAALRALVVTADTLPLLLNRVRDVRAPVRAAAYCMLHQKVSLAALPTAARHSLVHSVWTEEDDRAKAAGVAMCVAWAAAAQWKPAVLAGAFSDELDATAAKRALQLVHSAQWQAGHAGHSAASWIAAGVLPERAEVAGHTPECLLTAAQRLHGIKELGAWRAWTLDASSAAAAQGAAVSAAELTPAACVAWCAHAEWAAATLVQAQPGSRLYYPPQAEAQALLDELIPALSTCIALVVEVLDEGDLDDAQVEQAASSRQAVLRALLTLVHLADWGDEVGRRRMQALCEELLSVPVTAEGVGLAATAPSMMEATLMGSAGAAGSLGPTLWQGPQAQASRATLDDAAQRVQLTTLGVPAPGGALVPELMATLLHAHGGEELAARHAAFRAVLASAAGLLSEDTAALVVQEAGLPDSAYSDGAGSSSAEELPTLGMGDYGELGGAGVVGERIA